jgi:hypothetical protein
LKLLDVLNSHYVNHYKFFIHFLKFVYYLVEKLLDGGSDVLFADYGPQWESLRKVAHAAVRKYAVNEKLAYLVNDVVNETANNIKQKEGINNPFQPFEYFNFTMYNILASSAFGTRFIKNFYLKIFVNF